MSSKHLKIIAVSLAVLLLAWGASELFSRGSDTVTGSLALPSLAPGEVDTISIVKGADAIVLARQSATAWTVNGRRAAPDAVPDLLRALADSVPPELVAQDSTSFGRLNVDSATGRWLRVRGGGKPLLQLIVGARGSEYQSAYLRRPGESHVYLWRGRLAALLDRAADDWRDKRIAALQPDSITALDVARGVARERPRRGLGRRRALPRAAARRHRGRLRRVATGGFDPRAPPHPAPDGAGARGRSAPRSRLRLDGRRRPGASPRRRRGRPSTG